MALISDLPNATPQKSDLMEIQNGQTSSNNSSVGQLMQLSASENLAAAYDASAGVYSIGDFVSYDGTLYQCNTAIATPEAFDATKWDAVKVTEISGGVIQLTQAEYDLLTTEQKMNGSIYKITDNAKMYCLDKAYHPVEECTVAEYSQKTPAQQNDGTIYIQTDAETTGSDIPVSSGETETIAEMLTTQFVNNFVTLSGSAALNDNQCSIYGKIHSLRLYFTAVNAGSGWVTQAIVPEGHRPAGIMEFYLVNEAGGFNNAECRITTDGLLQVYSPTSSMKLWGQGWWISA